MSEYKDLIIKLREIIKSYYPHKLDEQNKFTILIVDDSAIARQSLIDSLEEADLFNFVQAENGMDGLYKLGQHGDKIGFICLDMEMPIMNGMDFYLKSKEANLLKNIPVIMVTSISEKKKVIELIKAGVNSYILKPFSPIDFLNNLIRIMLDNRKEQNTADNASAARAEVSAKDIYEKEDEQLGFKTGKMTEKAKENILNNPEENKLLDEKIIAVIKSKDTQKKSISLFFINERMKSLMSELFIEYLYKSDFVVDQFDAFIDFVRIKLLLQKKSGEILNLFDGKGLLSTYISAKELFNAIYHHIIHTKEAYDLERTEEIQMAITLYLYEYWRHIIIDYIQENFYNEFVKTNDYLNSINASTERKHKQFEQLINGWKKMIFQNNQLNLENLQKMDNALIKTKLT